MDDFDKEFPDFDWKNTPAYKHPGGKDCPCPKHEYVREQVKFTKQVNETGKDARVTLKFCPEHYNVYMNEVIPAMPMKYKILTKIALKIGAIKVVVLKHMQSDLCFYSTIVSVYLVYHDGTSFHTRGILFDSKICIGICET